nr:aminotransferase class IV [uncultured Blautia sp.]
MDVKFDECFQFGLGAFETIAVEKGRPVLLEKHLDRLERAAAFLGLGTLKSREISPERVYGYLKEQKESRDTEEEYKTQEHCALKLMLTKENVVFSMRPNHYTREAYEKGFVMDISQVRRNETSPLVYHKTMNYGDCILEKRNAGAAGMDERIFLNTRGQIAEGTVSNIFFVRDGVICTPEKQCGLLPGIIREYLCETEDVEEMLISPQDLRWYQECFVTNSLMGIMPVKQLGSHIFPENKVTRRLKESYDRMIEFD